MLHADEEGARTGLPSGQKPKQLIGGNSWKGASLVLSSLTAHCSLVSAHCVLQATVPSFLHGYLQASV